MGLKVLCLRLTQQCSLCDLHMPSSLVRLWLQYGYRQGSHGPAVVLDCSIQEGGQDSCLAWLMHDCGTQLSRAFSGACPLPLTSQRQSSKMVLSSTNMSTLERDSKNGTLQLPLTLESVTTNFCLSKRSVKASRSPSFTYSLGTFQTGVLALDAGSRESLWKPFKSNFSIPYSSMVLLDITPVGSQSHTFWGLIPPVQDLEVEVPPASQRKPLYFLFHS